MIKFFRRVRQDLLIKGKTSKYFKYAFGEVILVVIGILIALQINNWNELKKERTIEKELLTQIKTDLSQNLDFLKKNEENIITFKNAADSVIYSLEQKEKTKYFSIYVSIIHIRRKLNIANTGYTSLKSGLLPIVKNNKLKNDIIKLYEQDVELVEYTEDEMHNHLDDQLFPVSYALFKINQRVTLSIKGLSNYEKFDPYLPQDFGALCENLEFINVVKRLRSIYNVSLFNIKDAIAHTESVLKAIDEELQSFKI